MSSGPLVLAVPVFNGATYLTQTLESLNAQGDAVHWWLQDGNSKDSTVAIAQRLARAGDTVVSEPDNGQADAINRAMSKMGGEIIGFINADDCLAPGAAAKIVQFFDANPEIDLLYGDIEWIDEKDAITGAHSGRIDSLDEVLDIYEVWWGRRQWVQPEVFYRRALWERAGEFDTTLHLAFDYDFWVRCFRAGARVAHLPSVLAQFRLHAAQKSTAAERAADEIRAIVQKNLPDAAMSPTRRWAIQSQLGYDLYQAGKDANATGDFMTELLRHPQWLLSPRARSRVQAACAKLFTGSK